MKHQYAAIPLNLKIPPEASKITAIIEHNDQVCFGLDPPLILSSTLSKNNGKYRLSPPVKISFSTKEVHIVELQSFYDSILIHIRVNDGSAGGLLMLQDSGKMDYIDKNTDCFAVNRFDDLQTVAFGNSSKLTIRKYELGKWSKLHGRDIGEKIIALAYTHPTVFIMTPTKYVVMNLSSGAADIFPTSISGPSYIFPIRRNMYFTYHGRNAMILSSELASDLPPIPFPTDAVSHILNDREYAAILENEVIMYDFDQVNTKQISSFDDYLVGSSSLPGAKLIVVCKNSYLVATENSAYALLDFTDIISDPIELNSLHTISIASIFEQCWIKNDIVTALTLFRYKPFEDCFYDAFRLFPYIKIAYQPEKKYFFNCKPNSNERYLITFLDNLLICRSSPTIGDNEKILIDTVLYETYAELNNIKKLHDNVEGKPTLQEESIKLYAQSRKNSPSYGIYLIAFHRYEEAYEEFDRINSIEYMKSTLIQDAGDWNFVEPKITSLINKSPMDACEVLACSAISVAKSIAYVKENIPAFYPRLLFMLLENENISDKTSIANNLIAKLMAFLCDSIARDKVTFCKCFQLDPNVPDNEIYEEIGSMIIEIFEKHNDLITIDKFLMNMKQIKNTKVRIDIYKAIEHYDDAFELLWEQDGFDKCTKSALTCKNKPSAFVSIMKIMKNKLSSQELSEKSFYLLSNFISDIDIIETISNINDVDLESIGDILEKAYIKANKTRMNAQIEASFAKSKAFESMYEKVKLESQGFDLTSENRCATCGNPLGTSFIQRSPDGLLYHYRCIPVSTVD